MNGIIASAFGRARVVILLLMFILTVGTLGYIAIPKESYARNPHPHDLRDHHA